MSCNRDKPCKKCNYGHNTWLHSEASKQRKQTIDNKNKNETKREINSNVATFQREITAATGTISSSNVLLATAMVTVLDNMGQKMLLRAVIDFGSQGSMITTTAAKLLNLNRVVSNTTIRPVGGAAAISAKTIMITISPRFNSSFELMVECFCLQKIMKPVPDESFEIFWPHLKGLKLADPEFNKIGNVDLLLGAENIDQIIKPGLKKGRVGEPVAQDTEFGWIVSGRLNQSNHQRMVK